MTLNSSSSVAPSRIGSLKKISSNIVLKKIYNKQVEIMVLERFLSLSLLFISNAIVNRITLRKIKSVLSNASPQKNDLTHFKNNKNNLPQIYFVILKQASF